MMLRLIERNFKHLTIPTFVLFYCMIEPQAHFARWPMSKSVRHL